MEKETTTSTSALDAEGTKLFLRAQELDKELRLLLKKKSIFDKNVVTIRNNLKDCYEKLVINYYDFASLKEIEQSLWKIVFYRIIEEYRKKIRANVGAKGEKSDGSKDDLSKLCESFRSFLHAAHKFYNELIKKLQEKYNLKLDGTEYPLNGKDGNVTIHKSYMSCHRCLIFLGDLARYHRDLVNHPSQKDWSRASRYYKQALKLIPDNGNPHNQLAVLATYVDDEFGAVYHYFLSLACTHPFLTAKDNLQVLFEKNRQKFSQEGNESAELSHPLLSSEVKRFLSRFVRIHGILFTKTGLDKFEEYETELLREADNLLQKDEISEETLLNITVINLFSIYNIQHMTDSGQGATYAEISQKTLLVKYSLSLSLRFFGLTLKRSYSGEPKFLPAISMFLDFLRINTEMLKKTEERDGATWPLIWKELAKLLTVIGAPDNNVSIVQNFPAIKEELQLRGFVPFLQLYRVLPYPTSEIPEDVAKLKRFAKIREFGAFAMTQLPKVHLFFDPESGVYSDQPIIKSKSPQLNGARASPNIIVSTPNESPPPLEEENASPSKEDSMEMQGIEERLGLEDLVDDVDDEVILFKPGEGNNEGIIGSGRSIEKSTSSDKLGSSSPRASHQPPNNGFGLFGNSGNSNQSLFSFNNIFGQPQPQAQPPPQPNSFFGSPFMNSYTSPNGTPHQPPNPYMYQQTSPSNFSNENAFGNSFWSPSAPNSFFPSPQGDKSNFPIPNGPNPFLTPQSQAPSPQVVSPYGPTTPMTWLSPQMQPHPNETQPSPNQKMNELNTGNYQPPHPPHHGVAPPPGFQPLTQPNAPNLPFPFPGGSNQQPRYAKPKNPFVS